MGQRPSTSLHFRILSDKKEAQTALDDAEQHDRYLEECNDDRLNRLSRQSTSYAANRLTYHDLKYFEILLENAQDQLPLQLKKELTEVRLVPLMPSADAGMPHTRPGALICYPDLSRFFQVSTLIHELWHVHQRIYHAEWAKVFHAWGWTEAGEELLPRKLLTSRRYNPDTIDSPVWIFRATWIPVPVFKDISQPRVDETEIWFVHAKEGYHVRAVPEEMRSEYPTAPPAAFEHPREMAAYLLSDPSQHAHSPGYMALQGLISAVDTRRRA